MGDLSNIAAATVKPHRYRASDAQACSCRASMKTKKNIRRRIGSDSDGKKPESSGLAILVFHNFGGYKGEYVRKLDR